MTPQEGAFKPPTAKLGMMQEVFNLDEGPVTLSLPAKLSEESYEDLEVQLQLSCDVQSAEPEREEAATYGKPDLRPRRVAKIQ